MNIDPNQASFILQICLAVFFSNLLKYLISRPNLSFDLIEFEEYLKNYLFLHGFDPYSPLHYIILD